MSKQQQDIIPGMSRDRQTQLIQRSNFDEEQVKNLIKLYKIYDKSSDGTTGIPFQTFIKIPDFSGHPFISRITELFITDLQNPIVYAEQLVAIASFLSSSAPVEQKRKLAFRMLDINENGSISYDELYRLYKMLYHVSLSDDQIAAMIYVVMDRQDLKQPGTLTYQDFVKLVPDMEIHSRFTVDIQPR